MNGNKLHPNHVKTADFSHGPCLPHFRLAGYYGADQDITFTADLMVARADDYVRTFQRLSWQFENDVDAKSLSLFSLGRTHSYQTPRLEIGNRNGLIRSEEIADGNLRDERAVGPFLLTGPAPYWVSLTGANSTAQRPKPNGYRALIIREYREEIGGKVSTTPRIDTRIHQSRPANTDVMLVPHKSVTQFRKGDRVDMLVELITLPRNADDYYGPNEAFREHLTQHPSSWKTTHREAAENDLTVKVSGGELLQPYPLAIRVQKPEVRWTIQGGAGAIPVRLTGVQSPVDFQLLRNKDGIPTPFDQSLHGNDFWQVDPEPNTDTYTITFNLPSATAAQTWILRQESGAGRTTTNFMHPGNSYRKESIEFVGYTATGVTSVYILPIERNIR